MTYTTNNILMPHRPSRGAISRVALLAAYSRTGKRKQATADAFLLSPSHTFSSPSPHPINNSLLVGPALRTDDSVRHASVLRAASARHMVPTSSGISRSVLKPRHPLYLAAFNVRTLKQAGQQAALALTLDSLGIDVCCVSETRIQDASTDRLPRRAPSSQLCAEWKKLRGWQSINWKRSMKTQFGLTYAASLDRDHGAQITSG
ncbi:hypothetical protein T265_04139 [Opisthorchis viverrini]|uniref:Endonuclease/exonuclease/phosphatase domain-containing protein n=1 Tax=Opisthorchis viverrini TaxID=6198 RepID=A0A075AGZ2_OPIVI|nr:hypothetical protein T265_04139 [Opisthorchis viverrini]KER29209.1 hypothetical protein T265_04139 [Opisthorchis viverrini]